MSEIWRKYDARHNHTFICESCKYGDIRSMPTDWNKWDSEWPRHAAPWARMDRIIVAGVAARRSDDDIRAAILRHLRYVKPMPDDFAPQTVEETYDRIRTVRIRCAALSV